MFHPSLLPPLQVASPFSKNTNMFGAIFPSLFLLPSAAQTSGTSAPTEECPIKVILLIFYKCQRATRNTSEFQFSTPRQQQQRCKDFGNVKIGKCVSQQQWKISQNMQKRNCMLMQLELKRRETTQSTNERRYERMRSPQKRDYLVVGVALRIEGGERRGWDFVQPLSLWVRPRLVIVGNLGGFYLQYTDRAQQGATLTRCDTLQVKVWSLHRWTTSYISFSWRKKMPKSMTWPTNLIRKNRKSKIVHAILKKQHILSR